MATVVLGLNLIKAYDRSGQRVEALNDVSLEVYPGEMVALIGRTGAGQSALLYLLGGLHRPDSGRVTIEDQEMTGLEDQDLARLRANKLGYILQSARLCTQPEPFGKCGCPPIGNWDAQGGDPPCGEGCPKASGHGKPYALFRLSSSPPKNVRWLPSPGQWLTTRR